MDSTRDLSGVARASVLTVSVAPFTAEFTHSTAETRLVLLRITVISIIIYTTQHHHLQSPASSSTQHTASLSGLPPFHRQKNPRLSQNFPGSPRKIFQDLFGAHECLNIKKKTAFTYNIQSIVHRRKFSKMWTHSVIYYCCLFSI